MIPFLHAGYKWKVEKLGRRIRDGGGDFFVGCGVIGGKGMRVPC